MRTPATSGASANLGLLALAPLAGGLERGQLEAGRRGAQLIGLLVPPAVRTVTACPLAGRVPTRITSQVTDST